MAPSPPFITRMGVPWLTLSPTFSNSFSTTPLSGAGTSIVALSDSRVMTGSSALTASPGLTWISTTGTSLKSPMSGTVISVLTVRFSCGSPALRGSGLNSWRTESDGPGSRLARIDIVATDGVRDDGRLDRSLLRQGFQGGDRHPVSVHFEEVAQLLAVIRPAKPVGAEHPIATRNPRAYLIGKKAHVISRGNHRTTPVAETGFDIGLAWSLLGMEQVPALDAEGLPAQFGKARACPDIGRNAVVCSQQIGRRDHFAQDGT